MPGNYNKVARYYDFLSRLVFRKSIVKAQVGLLKFIPANSSMLIVGGGTGWVLEEISKIHPEGLQITYVEISSVMIELSQKRDYKKNKVQFVNQPFENYVDNSKYDIVLTAFLFDNFLENKILFIFNKLDELLKNEGIWLFADFAYKKNKALIWQKLLLKTMYLFFRLTCNIEARGLTNMSVFFTPHYDKIFEAYYYSRFIKSTAYKKNENRQAMENA